MVDTELAAHVEAFCRQHAPHVHLLPPDDTSVLIGDVSRHLALGPARKWWWEAAARAKRRRYEGEGLSTVDKLVLARVGPLYLVITDDEAPPWIAVSGKWPTIRSLLEESRFFEFFIVDGARAWAMFDTHHNELVIVGPGPMDRGQAE
jgi:hypothetical protein